MSLICLHETEHYVTSQCCGTLVCPQCSPTSYMCTHCKAILVLPTRPPCEPTRQSNESGSRGQKLYPDISALGQRRYEQPKLIEANSAIELLAVTGFNSSETSSMDVSLCPHCSLHFHKKELESHLRLMHSAIEEMRQAVRADPVNVPVVRDVQPTVDGKYVRHNVTEADTLVGLALKYNVTAEAIRKENNLRDNNVFTRKQLVIPTTVLPANYKDTPPEMLEVLAAKRRPRLISVCQIILFMLSVVTDVVCFLCISLVVCGASQMSAGRSSVLFRYAQFCV
eukprot:TRINITY_DN2769_c0_g1_i3.p1 TRINITY_DN2769_c0_g1~~TRINITY_DN2769_c0_g1_i3.p1  ORF type:complete len:282 (-),score=33.09 TRINITY_DN2769_c0_g1_i3:236-1081(-)